MSRNSIVRLFALWGMLMCSACRDSNFDLQDVESMLEKQDYGVTRIEDFPQADAQFEGLKASKVIHISGTTSNGIELFYSEFETVHQVIQAGFGLSGIARAHAEYAQSGGFGNVFLAEVGAKTDQPKVDSIFESLKQL